MGETLQEIGIYSDDQLHEAIVKDADKVYRALSSNCFDVQCKSVHHTSENMDAIMRCVYELTEDAHPMPNNKKAQYEELSQQLNGLFQQNEFEDTSPDTADTAECANNYPESGTLEMNSTQSHSTTSPDRLNKQVIPEDSVTVVEEEIVNFNSQDLIDKMSDERSADQTDCCCIL